MPDQTTHQLHPAPEAHRDPVVRGANPIDRYSLALQLIQVYPVVVTGVAVILPLPWLRILVAVLGLVIGTVWAALRERRTESADRRPRTEAISLQTAVETAATATTATATATTESVHGIRVDIWLHPNGRSPHEPAGHRPHRQSLPHTHRAIRPKPRPHHQSHADEPESEDRPGTPHASAPRQGAGLRRALCIATGRIHGQRGPRRSSELVHEDGTGGGEGRRQEGRRIIRLPVPAEADAGDPRRARLVLA